MLNAIIFVTLCYFLNVFYPQQYLVSSTLGLAIGADLSDVKTWEFISDWNDEFSERAGRGGVLTKILDYNCEKIPWGYII